MLCILNFSTGDVVTWHSTILQPEYYGCCFTSTGGVQLVSAYFALRKLQFRDRYIGICIVSQTGSEGFADIRAESRARVIGNRPDPERLGCIP